MTTRVPRTKIKDLLRGKKILIGILVIGIILAGGFWIWNEYFRPVPISGTPSLPKISVVTITTDKTEYEQGEMVNITMFNTLDHPTVVLSSSFSLDETKRKSYGQGAFLGFLEKFKNGIWIKITPLERMFFKKIIFVDINFTWDQPDITCEKSGYNGKFESKEERIFMWNQKILICDLIDNTQKIEQVNIGKYRITTEIDGGEKTIFSNEFTIK